MSYRRTSLVSRLAIVASTYCYAATLLYAYQSYLHPTWGYYGFAYSDPTLADYSFAFILLTSVAGVLPKSISRPSSVILLLLFTVVYVPVVVVTLCLSTDTLQNHWLVLLAIAIALFFSSLISRSGPSHPPFSTGAPGKSLIALLITLWMVSAFYNTAIYHSVMSFANLDTLYEQREAGASVNILTAYSQSLFSNVFSPTLFCIGLIYRKPFFILLGLAGSVFIYSISAQRTVLLLPIAIYLFYRLQSTKHTWLKTPATPITLIALCTFASTAMYETNAIAAIVSALLVFRTLALPGLTYSQYHEVFSIHGYTWWSHVKGFSSLVPAPEHFASNELWPGIGYIVGEYFYSRPDVNANANLFSGDGIAAGGWFGVIVIGLVFSAYLWILDHVSIRWDRRFASLAVLPLAISLTNGHLFTSLLSFGGLLWLLIFTQFVPKRLTTKS